MLINCPPGSTNHLLSSFGLRSHFLELMLASFAMTAFLDANRLASCKSQKAHGTCGSALVSFVIFAPKGSIIRKVFARYLQRGFPKSQALKRIEAQMTAFLDANRLASCKSQKAHGTCGSALVSFVMDTYPKGSIIRKVFARYLQRGFPKSQALKRIEAQTFSLLTTLYPVDAVPKTASRLPS
jgi:positive regulator of sigma E activity